MAPMQNWIMDVKMFILNSCWIVENPLEKEKFTLQYTF